MLHIPADLYQRYQISTAGASAGDDDARQKKEILANEGQKAVMLCLSKDPLQLNNTCYICFKGEKHTSFT
ncbi:hypothetical protein EMCRGX_G009846 [Ephydatia muelleri]